jgi:hypothetical protein
MCSRRWLDEARARADAILAARASELDPGLPASALLGDARWAPAIADLLGFEADRGKLYRPGRRTSPARQHDELDARLLESGLKPIAVDGTLARQLERDGRLVRLGNGLAIGPKAYREFERALLAESEEHGTVTLASFRDRAGVSRRVAQLVLERFDADRITLRVGDERRLRRRG